MINRRHVMAVGERPLGLAGGWALFGLSNDGERGGPACQALAVGLLRAL